MTPFKKHLFGIAGLFTLFFSTFCFGQGGLPTLESPGYFRIPFNRFIVSELNHHSGSVNYNYPNITNELNIVIIGPSSASNQTVTATRIDNTHKYNFSWEAIEEGEYTFSIDPKAIQDPQGNNKRLLDLITPYFDKIKVKVEKNYGGPIQFGVLRTNIGGVIDSKDLHTMGHRDPSYRENNTKMTVFFKPKLNNSPAIKTEVSEKNIPGFFSFKGRGIYDRLSELLNTHSSTNHPFVQKDLSTRRNGIGL